MAKENGDPYHPTWPDKKGYPFTADGGTYRKGAKQTTPFQGHTPVNKGRSEQKLHPYFEKRDDEEQTS